MGRPMIMGRRTFDSLPALLEGRRHIVLTRDPDWQDEQAEPAHSVEEALRLANAPQAMVLGGADLYRLFLPFAHRIALPDVAPQPSRPPAIPAPDPAQWRELPPAAPPAPHPRPP